MVKALVSRAGTNDIPISMVTCGHYRGWLRRQSKTTKTWLTATGFQAKSGKTAVIPDRVGNLGAVLWVTDETPDLWDFAGLAGQLPKGRYAFDNSLGDGDAEAAALGFALADYGYARYKKVDPLRASLVWPKQADRAHVARTAEATTLGRDLINTPANDLGPIELCDAFVELGRRHGAKATVLSGASLLDAGYPAIFTVGRASPRPPSLVDLHWGSPKAPRLTLVGKGVCFDTGGLDLKSASGMRLMKKDMGGAASVLALAHLIMDAALPVRLRVLVPAVENAVAGDAYRPGDVIETRKGLTIEVGNTDAEGRLILCDALTEADREEPDLLIDFATLTGAARVALGTDLPALFCDDDALVEAILTAGRGTTDPLWRMPLHRPYRRQLDSSIADLSNISRVPTGGAITAALFLSEFVDKSPRWAHLDTMAWNLNSRPGRPVGGDVPGVRAVFAMLRERYAP